MCCCRRRCSSPKRGPRRTTKSVPLLGAPVLSPGLCDGLERKDPVSFQKCERLQPLDTRTIRTSGQFQRSRDGCVSPSPPHHLLPHPGSSPLLCPWSSRSSECRFSPAGSPNCTCLHPKDLTTCMPCMLLIAKNQSNPDTAGTNPKQ